MRSIAHTVQVHTWYLAQFGWRGPQLHLKCRGFAHKVQFHLVKLHLGALALKV